MNKCNLKLKTHYDLCCCYLVAKLYPSLFNPMDCTPPGSPSMAFPRQEYQSGFPFPPPENLSDPVTAPHLLHWQILYH